MKKSIFIYLGYVLVLTLLFTSCKKDEVKPEGELSQDIKNFVPDTLLQDIMALGMPVYKGSTPPSFEKIYFASPFALVNSNRYGDIPGKLFADYKVQFSDQDNDELTVKVSYVNGPEEGNGLGAFISGSGNSFTVFVEVNSTYNSTNAVMLHMISGTVTATGIQNLYFANFMLDNFGNEYGYWIEEGEGRVLKDTDGNSPVITSLKSGVISKLPSASSSLK